MWEHWSNVCTKRSHCNLKTHPPQTSSSGVSWPSVSSNQKVESFLQAQHAVLGSSSLFTFTAMVIPRWQSAKGDARCARKIPALLARKSKRGCILETEAHFAAKHTTRLSLDACLNIWQLPQCSIYRFSFNTSNMLPTNILRALDLIAHCLCDKSRGTVPFLQNPKSNFFY